MLPLQLAGLALAGRKLELRYRRRYKGAHSSKNERRTGNKDLTAVNPIQTLINGVSATIAQISKMPAALAKMPAVLAKRPAAENYTAVIKSFLPANAKLLTPQYPSYAGSVQFADLDGDGRNELIASYSLGNEVKTAVLRKEEDRWHLAAEINNPGYDSVKYRSIEDLAGDGKSRLLLALSAGGKSPSLYGYSLENGKVTELCALNCDKFQVLGRQDAGTLPGRTRIAVWRTGETGSSDVEILGWNGSQLEPQRDTASYYIENVVPYYAQKVKKAPYSVTNWYNLSDALVRAGAYRDASVAIEIGMELDRDSKFKEKFAALKNQIKEQ